MMRFCLLLLILFQPFSTLQAQEVSVAIAQRMAIEAPAGYVNTHTVIHWSPTAEQFAIRFDILDEGRLPVQSVWQVFEVQTGTLLYEFADFIAWYAAGNRLLIRSDESAQPSILDLQTGQIIASLIDAGTTFPDGSIKDTIVNLDAANTLRVYDAETGMLRFSLEEVSGLPIYAPDGTRFVVNMLDTGLQVYDTVDFTSLYQLDGYSTEPRYETVWSPLSEQVIVVSRDDFPSDHGPRYIWTLGNSLSEPIYELTGAVVWSPDGDRIAAPSNFTEVHIYDSMSGERMETIRGYSNEPTDSLYWQAHYLIAESGDYAFTPPLVLSVWCFEQDRFTFSEGVDIGYQYSIENGEMVVFEPFRGITRITLETGAITYREEFGRFLPYISPDRRWIVGRESPFEPGVTAPIVVYQFSPLEPIAILEAHTEIVRYISWSPNSQYFASIGGPNTVIVWEISDDSIG